MPSFQKMFFESQGKPINYKGKTLVMMDLFPVKTDEKLRIVIESIGSDWRQGIALDTKGAFIINNEEFDTSIVIWHDTAPKTFEFTVRTKNGEIMLKNVWDIGDGTIDSWHNGAAMIVERLPKGRRYLCNDGHPDENFDDIIFRIEQT